MDSNPLRIHIHDHMVSVENKPKMQDRNKALIEHLLTSLEIVNSGRKILIPIGTILGITNGFGNIPGWLAPLTAGAFTQGSVIIEPTIYSYKFLTL